MKKKKRTARTVMTERERQFIQEYEKTGGNLPAVCDALGISSARAAALMRAPLVKDRISRSVLIAKERLEATAPHLVDLALQIVNDESISVKVRASLLDSLLDRAGVSAPKTPAVQVNINTAISTRAREILAEREKGKGIPTIDITSSGLTESGNTQ